MTPFVEAVQAVATLEILGIILLSSAFGLFVGATPGLSATMAVALLVPITFFLSPIAAIAAIVSCSAMSIFAGDIPGALLRIPGTPASAAYSGELYALNRKGELEAALGMAMTASACGGIIGTIALILAAPQLASFALNFSSFEYFWLALLGLSCAALVAGNDPAKGAISLALGLFLSTIGLDVVTGQPRYTFGILDLQAGVALIAVLIGAFAIAELLRKATRRPEPFDPPPPLRFALLRRQVAALWANKGGILRGGVLGTGIGALPGAGADIAAWIGYAVSRRLSRTPEKFGTGHLEGVAGSASANNSALSGSYVPALVFGIPGDSITAIVVGVLILKGIQPGPLVFVSSPDLVNAIYVVFFLANLLILPLGIIAILFGRRVLSVTPGLLFPPILLLCILGTFAINNSLFDLWILGSIGVLVWIMEENGYPAAPMVLGLVLGQIIEENFMASMIIAKGSLSAFFERPVAAVLGFVTLLVWAFPLVRGAVRLFRSG